MSFDPKEQLRKQLTFLNLSCDSFDAGFKDEAIRIATVLRVLFHQTKNSTSLITHLGSPTISLLSTVEFLPQGISTLMFHGMAPMRLSGGSVKYYAHLGDGPTKRMVSFEAWWEQPIFILNDLTATRRTTILGAANKDGGAHVDPNLTPEYEHLLNTQWISISKSSEGASTIDKAKGAHYVSLRQMGYEVLAPICKILRAAPKVALRTALRLATSKPSVRRRCHWVLGGYIAGELSYAESSRCRPP